MAHTYPYAQGDRLLGLALDSDFEFSASSLPPLGSAGGASQFKPWWDASDFPHPSLRIATAHPRATPGVYVATEWATLGTLDVAGRVFNYQGNWTGDLNVSGAVNVTGNLHVIGEIQTDEGDLLLNRQDAKYHYIIRPNLPGNKGIAFAAAGATNLDDVMFDTVTMHVGGWLYVEELFTIQPLGATDTVLNIGDQGRTNDGNTYISFFSSASNNLNFRLIRLPGDGANTQLQHYGPGNLDFLMPTGVATITNNGELQTTGLTSHAGSSGAFQTNAFNLQWDGVHPHLWVDTTDLGLIPVGASDAAGNVHVTGALVVDSGIAMNGDFMLSRTDQEFAYIVRPDVAGLRGIAFSAAGGNELQDVLFNAATVTANNNLTVDNQLTVIGLATLSGGLSVPSIHGGVDGSAGTLRCFNTANLLTFRWDTTNIFARIDGSTVGIEQRIPFANNLTGFDIVSDGVSPTGVDLVIYVGTASWRVHIDSAG